MLIDTPKVDSSNELGEDTWELFELIEKSFGVTLDYATLRYSVALRTWVSMMKSSFRAVGG